MDGEVITAMRTAAASAVATKVSKFFHQFKQFSATKFANIYST